MEENKNLGEQSSNVTPYGVATQESIEGRVSEDSPIEKFKNAKALYEAYKSLQSEFTKKCQKLSEYEKMQDNANAPCYLRSDWRKSVDEFFENNPDAKEYGEQIASMISSDNALSNSKTPLEKAYNMLLKNRLDEKEKYYADENNLIDYVLKNEQILSKILKISGENVKKSPSLISSSKSSAHIVTPDISAKSLDEAKQILRKMFN